MKNLIETKKLSFEYVSGRERHPVLTDLDFEIEEGSFVAILGHNGSGKSTLAKHFNAILQPTDGTVIVAGIDTSNSELIFDIRRQVGMVFQNPDNQIVATIVEEDVAFALENLGIEPNEIRERVDDSLKQVDMYKFKEHAPYFLSGGQKQRVAIAGIIAMRPKCIILDEPTAMLDPKGRAEVMKTVKMLNEKYGTTIIHITHFMDEAVQADRVVVIDGGAIILDDVPRKVFSNVELLKSVGLDVPQVTELAYMLNLEGAFIEDDILSVHRCVDLLTRLFESR